MAKGADLVDDASSPGSPTTLPAPSGASASGRASGPAPGEVGALHGKFRILGPRQSFGDVLVCQALHLGTGRRVELHMLAEGVGASSPEAARMLRAARAAGRAPHSNLLNVVDSGLDSQERPFVVYERFAGGSAAELVLQRGPCDLRLASEILGQVLDGLTALHERGIYHRQLRPEHVLVEGSVEELRVKLTGLGYCALRGRDEEARELPRVYSRYLSPEARRRELTVTPAVDIYAAGVLLRFLITGEAGSEVALPPLIEQAVVRATADDRDERFQSAEQFRACLSAITGPASRTSSIPSGSLPSALRFMVQRRATSREAEALRATRPGRASGAEAVLELYPVLLIIESLYARIGRDGWKVLLEQAPELELVLPAAGNGADYRAHGVPAEWVRRMLAHADELAARGNLRLVAELGEELARRGLRRFCATLPEQLTPASLVSCVPALFRSVARTGEVVLVEQHERRARVSVRAQREASLELSALFAGMLRGQLRALAPEAEVNWVAAESLGDGADILVLSW